MKKHYLLLFFTLVFCSLGQAQSYQTQVLYMYSFARYIQWPGEAAEGDFVIGVVGESEIKAPLEKMASLKKVNGRIIKIITFDTPQDIVDCNILFLPRGKSKSFNEVGTKILGKPILLVTEKKGLGEMGSAINFVEQDGKPKFEMNDAVISNAKLQVAPALKKYAIQL